MSREDTAAHGGVARDGGVVTLADRLDDLLVRLELWRPRRRLLIGLTFVLVIPGGWLLSKPAATVALDDLIPMADGAKAPDPGGAVGDQPSGNPAAGDAESAGTTSAGIGDLPGGGQTDPALPGTESGDGALGEAPADLVVHVAGAVRRPGLVTLAPGSRISDAVTAAGGPTGSADVHRLNLAAPVVDGMQVRVPLIDDESPPGELVQVPPSEPSDTGSPGVPVNINTASVEQLQTLPGIGPAIAAAIVSWRDERGAFRSVNDLDAVPGIGPAKLAALRDQIRV